MVKKYVIEIEQQYGACTSKETHMTVPPMHLYKVKGFDSLVFDEKGLDKLTPLDCYCDNECGIADAESNGYDCGLTDAWDAVTWLWYNGTISFDEWNAAEMMEYYKKERNAKEKDERIKNGNVSALKLYSYIKREINPYGNPTNETAYEFGNRILDYINDLLENNQ